LRRTKLSATMNSLFHYFGKITIRDMTASVFFKLFRINFSNTPNKMVKIRSKCMPEQYIALTYRITKSHIIGTEPYLCKDVITSLLHRR